MLRDARQGTLKSPDLCNIANSDVGVLVLFATVKLRCNEIMAVIKQC